MQALCFLATVHCFRIHCKVFLNSVSLVCNPLGVWGLVAYFTASICQLDLFLFSISLPDYLAGLQELKNQLNIWRRTYRRPLSAKESPLTEKVCKPQVARNWQSKEMPHYILILVLYSSPGPCYWPHLESDYWNIQQEFHQKQHIPKDYSSLI